MQPVAQTIETAQQQPDLPECDPGAFNCPDAGLFLLPSTTQNSEMQEKILLEQRLLRSQMNPHFIFNSLASVQNFIVKQDDTKASIYLSRFSELVRSILNSSVEEQIPWNRKLAPSRIIWNCRKCASPKNSTTTFLLMNGWMQKTLLFHPCSPSLLSKMP
jgi:hypothetical protein